MFFQAENKLRPLTLPPPTCLNFYSSIPSIRVVWMFSVNPTIDQMQLCICCLLWLQIVFLTTVRRIVTMHSRKKINRTSKGFAQTYLSPRDNSAMYLGFLEEMLMKKLKIYVFYSTLLFFYFSTCRSPSNPRLSFSFDESGNCCDETEVSTFIQLCQIMLCRNRLTK